MAAKAIIWTVAGLLTAATLTACDEDEQGRILRYEKGTYLGPADTPLEQETLDDLRQRARRQGGS